MLKKLAVGCALAALLIGGVAVSVYGVWYYEPEQWQAEREAKDKSKLESVNILASERVAYYTKVLAIFTGALSAFGVFQLVFLIRADNTASKTALAALKSAKMAEDQLSASVSPLLTISPCRLVQGTQTQPPFSDHVLIGIENSGNGTAVINDLKIFLSISYDAGGTWVTEALPVPTHTAIKANSAPYEMRSAHEIIVNHFNDIVVGTVMLVVGVNIISQDILHRTNNQVFALRFDHTIGRFVRHAPVNA